MKACIINGNTEYIINLEPITQLCGISFNKKNFIINSLYKYYSGSKYEYYEINMQENIKINGEKQEESILILLKLLPGNN